MPCSISPPPEIHHIPLAVLDVVVNVFLFPNKSYRTHIPSGRQLLWTGMLKGSAPWRSDRHRAVSLWMRSLADPLGPDARPIGEASP